MKYIATIIRNNSLGKVVEVDSLEDGQLLIQEWAKNQFERDLTEEEEESLENDYEIYNDSDQCNVYTFAVGIVE